MKASFRLYKSLATSMQMGMTLIEIMVVVIIIALVASGVAISVVKHFDDAKIKIAKTDIGAIHTVMGLYRLRDPTGCPTLEQLREEGELNKRNRIIDPWNTKYVIDCSGDEVDVFSCGPDKQENTEDDIR